MSIDIKTIAVLVTRFVLLYIREIFSFLKESWDLIVSDRKKPKTESTETDSSEAEYWWYQNHGDPMAIYPEDRAVDHSDHH
jgi:hypothetical protein